MLPSAVLEPVFAQAVMDKDTGAGSPGQHPSIIVGPLRGKRMSIFAAASSAQVAAALKALR